MFTTAIVSALICTGSLTQTQEKRPLPPTRGTAAAALSPLKADPAFIDFGFLPPNTPGVGTVILTNTSDKPVKIELVQPSCKCTTTTDLNGKEIPPGGTETLQVTLEGAPSMGMRRSSVKVMVEGGSRPLDIAIKGEVSLPVRIVPPYVNAVGGKNLTGRVVVESIDKKPFKILGTHGGTLTVQGLDGAAAEPRASYLVAYDLTALAGALPTHLYLETDAVGAAVVDLRVRSETIDRSTTIDLLDKRAVLGAMKAGVPSEATFTTRNARYAVNKATSTSSDIAVEFVRADRSKDGGLTIEVKVTPREGFTGFLQAPITLWAGEVSQQAEVIASVRSN